MDSRHAILDKLPVEILLQIGHELFIPGDVAHLILCCRQFHAIFPDRLYHLDVQFWNSSALFWACESGSIATAQRSLDAGASVNHAFFSGADRKRQGPLAWPISQAKAMMSKPTPGRPLSVAVRARRKEMVAFLLAQGAEPSLPDTRRAAFHNNIWFPIHWAVSCGSWKGGAFFHPPPCDPVPIDEDIVRLLLKHGADANQSTVVDPRTGPVGATHSHVSFEAAYALHMSLCEHAPVSTVRLLLEAGAEPLIKAKEFGCNGRWSRGLWTPFQILGPTAEHKSEARDSKMILLAQHSGEAHSWKFDNDEDTVPCMLKYLTPARVQLLQMMVEGEPQIGVSGVHALLRVWARQKRSALDERSRGAAGSQAQLLQSLEVVISQLLTNCVIIYTDIDVPSQARQVDLGLVFSEFCRKSQDGNIEEFEELLHYRGITEV